MKSFDVVIIGGGLGGLSCGAILSKEGLGVCVLEKHSVVGGCLQSFRREGRTLDTGMHYVGSLSEGQIMHQYLKYFGVIDSLRLQKLDENGFDEFHFKDGTSYCHAMGYENFIETLASQFPGERSGLKTLCKTIQDIGDLISPEILLEGKLSADGIKYMSESAYQEIRKHLRSEKLRNVLAGNCRLYGGEKSVTSLYEYGMVTHSNIQGAYAFVDGSQQLADALAEVIRSNGGEVCPNSEVLKIRLEANTVEYVETRDGERLQGKYIISSLHPVVTFSLLENNTVYKKAFFTRINSLKNTHGIFSTYLLTKRGTLKYVNRNNYMFNTQDVWATEGHYKGFNIPSVLMCMQPNHLSEHTEVVTLLAPMPLTYYQKWLHTKVENRGEEYREFKAEFSEAVIDLVAEFHPNIRSYIDKVYTASPLTYRDYTATPLGTAYGIVKDYRNPIVTHIPAKTRISNLLLTGQNLNIHGCIGTTVSSAVTSSEILGVEYLSKKIGNA